jgi:hypothetical protein
MAEQDVLGVKIQLRTLFPSGAVLLLPAGRLSVPRDQPRQGHWEIEQQEDDHRNPHPLEPPLIDAPLNDIRADQEDSGQIMDSKGQHICRGHSNRFSVVLTQYDESHDKPRHREEYQVGPVRC